MANTTIAAVNNYKKYFRSESFEVALNVTPAQAEVLKKLVETGFDLSSFVSDIAAYKIEELVNNITNPQPKIQNPVETAPKELDKDALKQMGIEIQNQNGNLIAIEVKKGATFQYKSTLKSFGFSWNPELKAWAKPA